MGIILADYIDLDDLDLYGTFKVMDVLEGVLQEEDGTMTVDNYLNLQEERRRVDKYKFNRDQLYAYSYERISLLMYQMDKREIHSEAEFLQQIRGMKQQTTEMRETLEEKYIKLGHKRDIENFHEYDKEEWLTPEEVEDLDENLDELL